MATATGCPDSDDGSDASIADAGADGDAGEAGPSPPALPRLTPCPSGWSEVALRLGPTVCEPWVAPLAMACEGAEARFVGEAGCQRVGSLCPTGAFPDDVAATGAVIYVDGAAAAGGDGSEDAPLSRIGEALASAGSGDVVLVAAGIYQGRFAIPPNVELRGACAERTVLTSPVAAPALTGVITTTGPGARLSDLSIVGAEDAGILVGDGGSLEVSNVLIDRVTAGGVLVVDGGTLTAESLVVRQTRPLPDGNFGRGVHVEGRAVADVRRASIESNRGAGVSASGAAASVTLVDTAIVGTRAESGSREFGRGINAQGGATLSLSRVLVEGNRDVGIYATDNATGLVFEDVVVRGTLTQQSDATGGRGFELDRSVATLRRVLIDDSQEMGIYADLAQLTLEDLVIRRIAPQSVDRDYGRGINTTDGTHLARRLYVESCHDLAFVAWGQDATWTIEDVLVRDTMPMEASGVRGRALTVLFGPTVSVTRGLFANSRELAVSAVGDRTDLSLSDVRVSSVSEAACASTTCTDAAFGVGIGAYEGAMVAAEGFVIEDASLCGVHVAHGGAIDLVDGRISGSAIGACVQDTDFDVERLTTGVSYVENGVNLDSAMLPVPSTGSAGSAR